MPLGLALLPALIVLVLLPPAAVAPDTGGRLVPAPIVPALATRPLFAVTLAPDPPLAPLTPVETVLLRSPGAPVVLFAAAAALRRLSSSSSAFRTSASRSSASLLLLRLSSSSSRSLIACMCCSSSRR